MALVGLVAFAVAADLLPYSHRGTDLGESATAFGTAYVGAIVVEATGGTNTITTSAGLVDGTKVTGVVGGTMSAANLTAGTAASAINGGAITNLNGELIADDTIDDDSIDFGDVTGADLTLTDCGAVTSSGKVTGTELALSATQWFDIVDTTQLVFIAAGVTNVIDADITTP
jgi:hypothetical protein